MCRPCYHHFIVTFFQALGETDAITLLSVLVSSAHEITVRCIAWRLNGKYDRPN